MDSFEIFNLVYTWNEKCTFLFFEIILLCDDTPSSLWVFQWRKLLFPLCYAEIQPSTKKFVKSIFNPLTRFFLFFRALSGYDDTVGSRPKICIRRRSETSRFQRNAIWPPTQFSYPKFDSTQCSIQPNL